MFRPMRRSRQLLSKEETECVLKRNKTGVLAVLGDDDYPYSVPLNYYYDDGKIYFHGAKTGHKSDAIQKCGKASFCVLDYDAQVEEKLTTYFRSVIAFGKVEIVEDREQKLEAVRRFVYGVFPDASEEKVEHEISREWNALQVMVLHVEHMTGKEAIELVRKREKHD